MFLVADSGNTRIKLAVFDGGEMVRLQVDEEWSSSSLTELLRLFPAIDRSLVCAVREVPVWLPSLLNAYQVTYQKLSHTTPLPIRIGYQTPETLGRDRIAAAAGAAGQFPGVNVLAIDAGTALTMDLVETDGFYPGGTISPGLRMRFSALHQQTFSLPEIEPVGEVPLIGINTHNAILAGVVNGMIYEIDNSINSLKNKYNDLHVILTGGDAVYLSGHLKNTIFVNENLVLNGLNTILRNFSE